MNQGSLGMIFLSILIKWFVVVFTIVTILAVFVPLNPGMPNIGIDSSWKFSMNQAVGQKLIIGKEIIFTFGPFSSIFTRIYHPATDHLMIFGSIIFGLCYATILLYLAKNKKPYFLFIFLSFLASFMNYMELRDVLFISYPLLVAFWASKYVTQFYQHKKTSLNFWKILTIALVFSPLGLLPLIKGSFILMCGATAIVTSFYFSFHRFHKLALIALISPFIATIGFWICSGQSLLFLPDYFIKMSQIISGYTEAMALPGDYREIIYFLIAATILLSVFLKLENEAVKNKFFLSICLILFLFIDFKIGFVRHDFHAMTAGSALVIAALILGLVYMDKRLIFVLFISILTWSYITKDYASISINQAFENFYYTYANAWNGLRSRMANKDNLKHSFEQSLAEIRKTYAIPALQGTTDIYSYGQDYLLASNNLWNPRPIIQSYQVYTPLTSLNEQHLRNNSAPDNILFCVQPLDGCLPSLEDGLSWPALFDNYIVTRLDNNIAYLRKKQTVQNSSVFDVIYEGKYKTGDVVLLPPTIAPIYAQIDLKLTLLGKILSLLFKPTQLRIKLQLKDSTNRYYRVFSNMMDSGFFISPLVKNTNDFVYLSNGNQSWLQKNTVKSFVITPSYGGSILWSSTFSIVLKVYGGKKESASIKNFF
jgi:hypothetical protein